MIALAKSWRYQTLTADDGIVLNNLDQFGKMCLVGALGPALVVRSHIFLCVFSEEADARLQRLTAQSNRPDLTQKEESLGHTYTALLVIGYIGRMNFDGFRADNYTKLLNALLVAGAPVDTPDMTGRTPLHHASSFTGTCDLVKLLLKHKANVNFQDRFGATPLLLALEQHIVDVIPMLLDAGANMDITNGEGSSPRSKYPTRPSHVAKVVRDWLVKHEGKGSVLQGDRCSQCMTRSASVKRCARCRSRLYCSPECQREFTQANTRRISHLSWYKGWIGKNTRKPANHSIRRRISSS